MRKALLNLCLRALASGTLATMSIPKNKTWLPVLLIAGALLAWMAILAIGAYQAPVGGERGGDFRKLWVVAATTGGFLLLWAVVLVRWQVKVRRQKADSPDNRTSETTTN